MNNKNKKIATLEQIIALLPGNIYWKDCSGKYLGCNQNQASIIHLKSPEEVIGKTMHELFKEEYIPAIEKTDNEIMLNDVEMILEENGYDIDGNPAVYLTRKIPLHDDDGKVAGLLGFSIDITEHRKTAENLRLANEKIKNDEIFSLRKIISFMPGNVYWKDNLGHFLGCNDNVAKILKLPSCEDIVGKTNLDVIHDEELAALATSMDQAVMASNQQQFSEELGFDINGKPATYLSKKIPLRDPEGDVVGLLGLSLDITDRKKMEVELSSAKKKAEAANAAKTQFLLLASHELRTPLSGIIGLARILKDGGLTIGEEKEYLEKILDAANYQLSVVDSILDFSNLASGKLNLSPLPLDLQLLIHQVVEALSRSAENKNIELSFDYDADAPRRVIADARMLRQIFTNLIDNAIKFTAQGHVKINLRCVQQTAHSAQFEISVIDTGVGIAKEKFDSIFETFSQISNSYVRSGSRAGAGLGLSIVKAMVELMNGEVFVESEIGRGSVFCVKVTLPKEENL